MFRFLFVGLVGVLALGAAGCDDVRFDGLERAYVSDETVVLESDADWAGERISVFNNHGDVEVIGVAGLTRVRLSGRPSITASSREDAEAAFPDVLAHITLERAEDTLVAGCHAANADHGSADAEHAGCAELRVEVPAGSASAPLDLWVAAELGGAKVSGVTGSARVKATFELAASVTPVSGSRISIASNEDGTNAWCQATLALPESLVGSVFVAAFAPGAAVHSGYAELPVTTCTEYPTYTQQTVYPGTGPYPCIHGSLPGLSQAPGIELLAMHGDATLARGLDAPLPFVGGACPVE